MALAVYIPFPEDDSNSTNHNLVSTLEFLFYICLLYFQVDGHNYLLVFKTVLNTEHFSKKNKIGI